MSVLNWIVENGSEIVDIAGRIVLGASIVTAASKTPGRRSKMSAFYKLLELAALNIGRAKDQPKY